MTFDPSVVYNKEKPLKKEVNEDLQKLGYKNIDIPTNVDISDLQQQYSPNPGLVQDQTKNVAIPTKINQGTGLVQSIGSKDLKQQEPETRSELQISKEEQKRRDIQSEFDKTKSELEKAKQREEYMMKMLAGIAGTNQSQSQISIQKQEELKEPELWDFINRDEYEPDDMSDARTKTGQAYIKYQRKLREYDMHVVENNIIQKQQNQQQINIATRQARVLADRYQEFKNPFTGEPDLNKINNFIQTLSTSEEESLWVDLYEFQQSKKNKTNQSKQKDQTVVDKIGQRANQVQPVASKGASQEKGEKPISDTVKQIVDMFGKVEIPIDAEFE